MGKIGGRTWWGSAGILVVIVGDPTRVTWGQFIIDTSWVRDTIMTTIWLTTIYYTSMMRMTHPRGGRGWGGVAFRRGWWWCLLFRSFFDPLHMDGNGQYMSPPPPFGCLCQTRVSVNFSLNFMLCFLFSFFSLSLSLSFACF
jgi:hypothetical protein